MDGFSIPSTDLYYSPGGLQSDGSGGTFSQGAFNNLWIDTPLTDQFALQLGTPAGPLFGSITFIDWVRGDGSESTQVSARFSEPGSGGYGNIQIVIYSNSVINQSQRSIAIDSSNTDDAIVFLTTLFPTTDEWVNYNYERISNPHGNPCCVGTEFYFPGFFEMSVVPEPGAAAVPEPGSMLMMLTQLLALVSIGWLCAKSQRFVGIAGSVLA